MKYALFRAALFSMTLRLLAIAGAVVLLLVLLGFLLSRRKPSAESKNSGGGNEAIAGQSFAKITR